MEVAVVQADLLLQRIGDQGILDQSLPELPGRVSRYVFPQGGKGNEDGHGDDDGDDGTYQPKHEGACIEPDLLDDMQVEVVEDDDPVGILKQFLQFVPLSFCRHLLRFLEYPNIRKKLAFLLQKRKNWLSLYPQNRHSWF